MKKERNIFPVIIALILVVFAFLTLLLALPSIRPKSHPADSQGGDILTVIIDAGHGGEDGGAVGVDGVFEKDLNLDISMRLGRILEQRGVRVIYTRTEDILLYDRNVDYRGKKKALDLRARMDISKANPGSIFISIHMNSFTQSKYDGLQVYYPISDDNSMRLAGLIQDAVRSTLQPENTRKPKAAGSNIYLLCGNPNTSVLIECGFLSNPAECARLNDDKYRESLAEVIAESIIKYSGKDTHSS